MSQPASESRFSDTAWRVLQLLLTLESLLLLWTLGITVGGVLGEPEALLPGLSLVVITALALLWVVLTLIGAAKQQASWVRGAALTIHVLLFATGTGSLQMGLAPLWLSLALIAAGVVGFVAAIVARPAVNGSESDSAAPDNDAERPAAS